MNKSVDGKKTLNENLADNTGLKQSYKAYQMWQKMHKREALLPGFESFTPSQLFYLGFANVRICDQIIKH